MKIFGIVMAVAVGASASGFILHLFSHIINALP